MQPDVTVIAGPFKQPRSRIIAVEPARNCHACGKPAVNVTLRRHDDNTTVVWVHDDGSFIAYTGESNA